MQTKPLDLKIARRLRGDAIERPRDEVPQRLPLALRTVQHSWISRGTFEPSWSKRMIMAKWLISGKAEMAVDGRWLELRPGSVAIYLPSIRHHFRALGEVNEFCWFTMDGPQAESFVLSLGFESGVYADCPPPLGQIRELMNSFRDPSIRGRRASSLLGIRLWYDIAGQIHLPTVASEVQRAQELIQREYSNVNLSATWIAEQLNYHRGSLSRLFHKETGMTIIDYITEFRLQEAKSMLLRTNDKITEIARKCGFRDATYFGRWLRKHTSLTPRELREAGPTLE